MTDNTMREGKLWAFLHDSIHEAYKKLSTTGTSCEYHALLDSIAAKVADDVDARFLQACAARTVPEGYVMVPVEPTKAMIDAGRWHEYRDEGDCAVSYVEDAVVASVWSYMLSAAPDVKK